MENRAALHTQGSQCSMSRFSVGGAEPPTPSCNPPGLPKALGTGWGVGMVPWALHTPFFTAAPASVGGFWAAALRRDLRSG